jgi:DNA-binding response OmpR family regulator
MSAAPLLVLVVEDNDDLRAAIVGLLASSGFIVAGVPCAEDVDDSPSALADIYVLDINLPGEDGISLARRIRLAQPEAAIVMTTARARLDQRLEGYESGADVYLSKPVAPAELLACLQALTRRLVSRRPAELVLAADSGQLTGPLGIVHLQPAESKVLAALARAEQRTLERWQLEQLFGVSGQSPTRAVLDVRVSRLRRKLHEAGAADPALQAVPQVGYRLCQRIEIR